MERKDQLHELHLALEGVVESLSAAHRIASSGPHGVDGLNERLDPLFGDAVALRNYVREILMRELSKPAPLPTIRKGK